MAESIYDFSATALDGSPVDLADYRGQVLLIVNTASKCGFTPQYKALESLHQRYHERGFSVLGFPCNQFGNQEPGDADQISEFCELNFGVTFPLFTKIDVNGPDADPLYEYLKGQCPGLMGSHGIKWNFTKFLVGKDGKPVDRYAPQTKPESLAQTVEKLLDAA